MSADDIFLIEVGRRGQDGIGTPVDYETMRADIIALQAIPAITELDDISDVDTTGVADGDLLIYEASSGHWIVTPSSDLIPRIPYEVTINQNSSNVPSTTSTSTYQVVITADITLPAGNWKIVADASVLVSHSVSGKVVRASAWIGGAQGTPSMSAACPLDPVRTSLPCLASRTGQSGTVTVYSSYRLNTADGTAYCGGGVLKIRLYPEA